jgi:hypothetical protein
MSTVEQLIGITGATGSVGGKVARVKAVALNRMTQLGMPDSYPVV